MRLLWAAATCLVLGASMLAQCAAAGTLEVGPGKPYRLPSQAIAAAGDGDRIVIGPGTYADCAVLHLNNVVIEGSDRRGGTVLAGKTCMDKAILIAIGNNITVRNLTLARAHSADFNGAGIRDQSRSLTVDGVRFLDNEDGILTSNSADATLVVRNSEFLRNGSCRTACAHGIYAGRIAMLRVEHSRFLETREGHHIKSRAARTEVIGCDIADGPRGTASYLIDIPNGGAVMLRGNTMEKGPQTGNQTAAIMIGAEGVSLATPAIVVADNRFRNDGTVRTTFVENRTGTPAQLSNNRLTGPVDPLKGPGTVR